MFRATPKHGGLSLDTLRADRLGAYGYGRGTSPNLDALGLEGIVFDNLSAPSSKTASSHMSMFTGVHTGAHGIINFTTDLGRAVSAELPLAAELFSDVGYDTAAFTGGGMLRAELGFARGFDVFDHRGGGAQKVFSGGWVLAYPILPAQWVGWVSAPERTPFCASLTSASQGALAHAKVLSVLFSIP